MWTVMRGQYEFADSEAGLQLRGMRINRDMIRRVRHPRNSGTSLKKSRCSERDVEQIQKEGSARRKNGPLALFHTLENNSIKLPGCTLPRGFAPKIAKLTLAFLPSIIGLGSLQALSAAGRSPMIT